MTKKHLIAAVAVAGFSTLGIAGLASAATLAKPTPLAQELAQKFNLKESEVQAVLDQHRDKAQDYRQQEHQQRYSDKLSAEVQAGRLTSAQKDKLTAKNKELMTFMESLKDKTAAERRTAMEQKRTELQTWAKDNNIDTKYLGFGPGKGFGAHGEKGAGHGYRG